MSRITLAEVKAEAERILIDLDPDHRNPGFDEGGCVYVDADGDHCLAAQIIVNLGGEIPGYLDPENESRVDEVEWFHDILDIDALLWLGAVQREADSGHTWYRAVRLVNGRLPFDTATDL